jgi:hypothetical protein
VRVDCYHAGKIPPGRQVRGDVNTLSDCRIGEVQLYLVRGMSDCDQKRIGEFGDGKVRDAAARLILIITNTNCGLGKVLPRGDVIVIVEECNRNKGLGT